MSRNGPKTRTVAKGTEHASPKWVIHGVRDSRLGRGTADAAEEMRGDTLAVLERLSDVDAKRYAGQWVAVSRDGTVLASGSTASDVSDQLKRKRQAAELVYRVPTENEPASYY
jgi:hypothetical protein